MTDYPLTKIKGVALDVDGVLSPSAIPIGADGQPMRMANIKDGFALQLAVRRGIRIAIITGGNTSAMQRRFEMLGLTDIYQGAAHKLPVLQQWMADNGLQPDEVAYIGDDIPDLMCMHHVGLSCAPADAAADVRAMARYISPFAGGHGCVRDVLEQILKAHGLWMDNHDSFGW